MKNPGPADRPLILEVNLSFERGIELYQINNYAGAAIQFRTTLAESPLDRAAELYLAHCTKGLSRSGDGNENHAFTGQELL